MAHKKWIGNFVFLSCLLTPNWNLFSQAGISLYLTDESHQQMYVIDTETFAITATIPLTNPGPRGLAINADNTFAYVGVSPGVNLVNLTTQQAESVIFIGGAAGQDAAITPDGTTVYVPDGSMSVWVIDTATNVSTASIGTGSQPSFVAIQPVAPFQAYVSNFGSGTVTVIDTNTMSFVTNIVVGTSSSDPSGIAATPNIPSTPNGLFAYVGFDSGDTITVIDAGTNTISSTVAVGTIPIDVTIANVPSPPSPLSPGAYAYTANSTAGTVSVINTAAFPPVTVTTLTPPNANALQFIAATPDGKQVFVIDGHSDISVIDTSTNEATLVVTIIDSIPGGVAMGNVLPNPQPQPPSNLTGQLRKVIFATQTEYIHKLQWSPSTDTTVVNYILFRNGSQIAVISASGPFEYNDQNRHKNESDVYTLVSVNASGAQSTPITLNFNGK